MIKPQKLNGLKSNSTKGQIRGATNKHAQSATKSVKGGVRTGNAMHVLKGASLKNKVKAGMNPMANFDSSKWGGEMPNSNSKQNKSAKINPTTRKSTPSYSSIEKSVQKSRGY